ncbi:MAG: hypothetical protein LBS64_02995 [Spirochaetaceae bacterium]|jgi:hypothetical protein|nr:hypothetical protein [Spirochaetaceae bacterium]
MRDGKFHGIDDSIIGETRRPKQKDEVRLLARNVAQEYTYDCGNPAVKISC